MLITLIERIDARREEHWAARTIARPTAMKYWLPPAGAWGEGQRAAARRARIAAATSYPIAPILASRWSVIKYCYFTLCKIDSN